MHLWFICRMLQALTLQSSEDLISIAGKTLLCCFIREVFFAWVEISCEGTHDILSCRCLKVLKSEFVKDLNRKYSKHFVIDQWLVVPQSLVFSCNQITTHILTLHKIIVGCDVTLSFAERIAICCWWLKVWERCVSHVMLMKEKKVVRKVWNILPKLWSLGTLLVCPNSLFCFLVVGYNDWKSSQQLSVQSQHS